MHNTKQEFDELIDNYWVPAVQKELWALNLSLLDKFDNICEKYNIKYSLAFGTLIGAVRHENFIPWDDDVDVMMFREDYNKLQQVFSDDKIVLIPPYTNIFLPYAQLKYIEEYSLYKPGIDIFLVDKWPEKNDSKDYLDEIRTLEELEKDLNKIFHQFKSDSQSKIEFNQKLDHFTTSLTKYNHTNINTCGVVSIIIRDSKLPIKKTFHVTALSELNRSKFNKLSLWIPYNYDEILNTFYPLDDYKQYPSVDKRFTSHNSIIRAAQKQLNEV